MSIIDGLLREKMLRKSNYINIKAHDVLVMHTGFTDPAISEDEDEQGSVIQKYECPASIIERLARFIVENDQDMEGDIRPYLKAIRHGFRMRQMAVSWILNDVPDPDYFHKLEEKEGRTKAVEAFKETVVALRAAYGDTYAIEPDILKIMPVPKRTEAQIIAFPSLKIGDDLKA